MLRECGNTAPGEDGIHYALLRDLSDSCFEFLQILNIIFEHGVFPVNWQNALFLPFPKPNKPPNIPSSYRPIALTSCICKLFVKVVNVRLVHLLEIKNALSPYQYGFRKMRSTVDALARLEGAVLDAFSLKKQLVAVFFDIEKAYDTTWRFSNLRSLHTTLVFVVLWLL
jgi:hypothetical protein